MQGEVNDYTLLLDADWTETDQGGVRGQKSPMKVVVEEDQGACKRRKKPQKSDGHPAQRAPNAQNPLLKRVSGPGGTRQGTGGQGVLGRTGQRQVEGETQ